LFLFDGSTNYIRDFDEGAEPGKLVFPSKVSDVGIK
jgi:hypothetical protein